MKIRLLVTIIASLSLVFFAPGCGDSGGTGTGDGSGTGTGGTDAGADDADTGTSDDAGTGDGTGPGDTSSGGADDAGTGTGTGGNDTGGTGTGTGGTDTGGTGTGGTDTNTGGGGTDTTDTPPAGNICPEIWACIQDECGGSDDAAACADGATETCGPPAEEAEWTAATTLLTCMTDNLCELTEGSFGPECQRANCLAETVACWAAPAGENTCSQMRSCTTNCVDPIFGTPDLPCQRECLEAGSAEAVDIYVNLELCVLSQCWDKEGEEFTICKDDAESNPTCGQNYTECLGDIGAGPGAGAGGSK